MGLTAQARMWPTANVPNGWRKPKGGMSQTGITPDGKKRQVGLHNAVEMWPTAVRSDGERLNQEYGGGNKTLLGAAMFRTPRSSDADHGGPNQGDSAGRGAGLSAQEQSSTNGSGRESLAKSSAQESQDLREAGQSSAHGCRSRQEFATPRSERWEAPDSHGERNLTGQLNPLWVGQLMGYPEEYLLRLVALYCERSETLGCRRSRTSSTGGS